MDDPKGFDLLGVVYCLEHVPEKARMRATPIMRPTRDDKCYTCNRRIDQL